MQEVLPSVGQPKGARGFPANQQSNAKHPIQQSRSERAPEVRHAMAPVEAGVGEPTARGLGMLQIDTQSTKEFFPIRCKPIVAAVLAEAAHVLHARQHGDAEFSGKMVITGAREDQLRRGVLCQSSRSIHALHSASERLESQRDRAPAQAVKLVSTQSFHPEKPGLDQELQMIACRLGRNIGQHGEFTGRPGFSSHQAPQHCGPGGIADESSGFREMVCIHSSIVYELSMSIPGENQSHSEKAVWEKL